MTVPRPSTDFQPELVVLLHADPTDAVTRALIGGHSPLGWPLAAISAQQLIDDVAIGHAWTFAGRRIEPQRAAVINRLPMADRLEPGDATAAATVARQAQWSRLRAELGRFAYASALPTASSIIGCHGSLLDQWEDLPRLVPGLRVPDHSAPSLPRALHGNVFSVNRWTPYSLGKPLHEALASGLAAAVRLDYVRPDGYLVHLAQVGDAVFFPNPPPPMSPHQHETMIGVARALAAVSGIRILEHAFFLGNGPPVLYSSSPVPVLSGGHALYPELVQQGLRHDIQKFRRHGQA